MKGIASQNEQIRAHLESGKTITALEALRRFGCLRLSGRIYDLTHEHGMVIHSRMVTREGKRIAEYSLEKK
jgi:hypothetical protein